MPKDPLIIAGRRFRSRLMVGTGKFPDAAALKTALDSGRPTVIDVPVDAEIPQPAVATWELPPLPHPEPAFGWPDL